MMETKEVEQTEEALEVDRFKDVFKYYKRKQPPPDLSQAIDVDSFNEVTVVMPPTVSEEDRLAAQVSGLTPPHTWTIHSLVKHPGLLVVRNPFTRAGQLAWVKRCLRELPCATNKTNLASHGIHLRGDTTWWHLCSTSEGRRSGLRHKLRWVTLGYHHNWDTKEYSEESRGEAPECLEVLCGVVARVLGVGVFQAQAAIINYYPPNTTLSPHTDHSEPYATAPLLSFSFGQSAVFLIGGPTKATEPSAVVVHSGDVVVMSGQARLSYHAVPRILPRDEWRRARRKRKKGEDGTDEETVGVEEEPWATKLSSCKVKNEMVNIKRKNEETEAKMKKDDEDMKDTREKGEERKATERRQDKEKSKIEKHTENKTSSTELSMQELGNNSEKMMKENDEVQIVNQDKKESEECIEKDLIMEKNKGEDGPEEPKKRKKMEEEKTELRKEEEKDDENSKNRNDTNMDEGSDAYDDDDGDIEDILEYLRTCRINMNVRQVLPPSMDSLPL